jgi:flagellar basal-body rod modification protein FlgD
MSVSSVASSATSTTTATTTKSSNTLSSDDFLKLLVEQLQNQDPLEPTDTSEIMNQMVSYASYDQAAQTNETLTQISKTLDGIATALDISV